MRQSLLVVLAAVGIALGAQVSVPMVPVPTTLQTLAIFTAAVGLGARRASAATALYLAAVLIGLPVLSSAQQAGGAAFLEFKAAGYVLGFVPAAALCGWLGQGPWWRGALAALAGHALVLAAGALMLLRWLPVEEVLERGVQPFLVAALVKSVLAGILGGALRRRLGLRRSD